ncbi:hypothetical protein DPMN_005131 [Dreissena polymorpha]|uniref:Uncharacterized protein n=1 Tax=Dreissena polymorpha TaxID=45954 RepID=A0A9D4MPQ0_DREPO|nr:hypothetical protein DPMN_005131 [Dreissena polymorpha]
MSAISTLVNSVAHVYKIERLWAGEGGTYLALASNLLFGYDVKPHQKRFSRHVGPNKTMSSM